MHLLRRDFITDSQQHPFREKTDRAIKKRPPWKEYNLHIVVFVLVVISMFVGVKEIEITDTISVLLLPLIYALVLGLALYLAKPIKFVGPKQSKVAEGAMVLFIGVLITKLAISSGQAISSIFQVGPALILQQIGNLGTLLALPIALLFGFRREVIGMTSSICREPNLGVIIDKYGFKSPETRGVLAVFVIGSILGTPFISFLSSISASLIPMHPYAYAMASGVGSASMNAAALAPLMHMFPSMATQLEAFAGCSKEAKHDEYATTEGLTLGKLERWATFLVIFSFIVAVGNYIGFHTSMIDAFIGMLLISLITIIGMSLERLIPWNIQAIIYISLIGIFVAIPGVPTADFIVHYVSQIELTTICTAFLAYVGIAIGNDWEEFKKIGWKGIVITLIVISGTYLCSAAIAHITLVATGMV